MSWATRRPSRTFAGLRARIALSFVFAVLLPQGSPADALTLADTVRRAIDSSPSAHVADLETARQQALAKASASVYWPHAHVSSRAGYSNRLDDTLETVDATGELHEYGLATLGSNDGWFNFHIGQILFDLQRWTDARRAELGARAAAIAAAKQRESVAYDAIAAYVATLRIADRIEQHEARGTQLEDLDRRAASLLEAGRCLPTERDEVALYLRENDLGLRLLREQLRHSRSALALLTGIKDDDWAPDASSLVDVTRLPTEPEPWRSAPEVRLQELQVAMEEEALAGARAGAYPTVAIGGGYAHHGAKRFDNFVDEFRVGLDFHLPIFDGQRNAHTVAAAGHRHEAARVRLAALEESARFRLEDLRNRLAAAQQRLPIAEQRLALGHERIRVADLALDAQRGSVSIALAARREVEHVALAWILGRYEPVLLWAEIMRESGKLVDAFDGRGEDRSDARTSHSSTTAKD